MIETRIETVTPEKAAEYLNTSEGNPRYKRRIVDNTRVSQIARDIAGGRWETNHQGIAFNESGCLIDGHHRMMAVIEANKPIEVMVTRGIPDGNHVIDNGQARTTLQTFRAMGMGDMFTQPQIISTCRLALCRLKYGKVDDVIVSNKELRDYMESHVEEITWLSGVINKRSTNARLMRKAKVLYPLYIAYLTMPESREKLNRAVEVIATGFSESADERALVLIRNKIIATREKHLAYVGENLSEYIQGGLRAYLEGRGDCGSVRSCNYFEDYYNKNMKKSEFGI